MKFPLTRALSAVCLSLVAFPAANALVITGSDLFSETIRDAILEEMEAVGLKAVISFDGSLQGLRNLESGLVDASLLALPERSELETQLRRYPLCYQVVACAAHASNPVIEISYNQLVGIFEENGLMDSWSALTGDPTWANRQIDPMASRLENTVTLELFNAMVLDSARLKPTLRYISGEGPDLLATVVANPAALLLMPAMDLQGPVKYLAVKRTAEDQAYTPSNDNVFFGDYPLRLPFYLVVSPMLDSDTVGKLLQVLYSEAVTAVLEDAFFMPVPGTEQRALMSQFD